MKRKTKCFACGNPVTKNYYVTFHVVNGIYWKQRDSDSYFPTVLEDAISDRILYILDTIDHWNFLKEQEQLAKKYGRSTCPLRWTTKSLEKELANMMTQEIEPCPCCKHKDHFHGEI